MRYLICLTLILLFACCKKSDGDPELALLVRNTPRLADTFTWTGRVWGGYQPASSSSAINFDSSVAWRLPITVISNILIAFGGDTLGVFSADTKTGIIIYGNGPKNPNPSLTYYTVGDSMKYYEEIYQVANGADLYRVTSLTAVR